MKLRFLLGLCLTIFLLLTPAARLSAYTYSTDVGGCGYQECRSCPTLAPSIALAAAALAGIIAAAIQTSDGGHHHND